MNASLLILFTSFFQLSVLPAVGQAYQKGKLLYENSLSSQEEVADWRMEGAGEIEIGDGWMKMLSRGEKGHHVFWCPREFPKNFIAEWEVKNVHTEAGLCIVFFAAKGVNGEDLFDNTLPARNGTFSDYTKGAIHNYHISYYANSKNQPEREYAHLRKNKGFHKVQSSEPGIAAHSTEIHHLQLIKQEGHILLYIDERKVIDWIDDGKQYGDVLQGGKIGFRQMKWTQFAYRHFKVWECL